MDGYAETSGQLINYSKSSLCFSYNTPLDVRHNVYSILRVMEQKDLGVYLGLPTPIGINKCEVFQFMKDRMWQKLNSWKQRYLSRAGKEVMLKTVLQALPTYAMDLFLVPQTICYKLQRLMARFWWGRESSHERGMHWVSWEWMAKSKFDGGLGFKKLHEFNLSMLGKHAWAIFTRDDSLVTRTLKAKYFPFGFFLDSEIGSNPSYLWRSLWKSKKLIALGSLKRVGHGRSIWEDPWVLLNLNGKVSTPQQTDSDVFFVSDLIQQEC
ncbi:uncharacterized mitochondrial protein AtMg00310-like [Manihot esculenta]|uniref:uncharacterized mitochondrial protein AtMg00310-like n=1 Tax=Manihot esculenta TaxID=3983 RepID=UPI001CC3C747|nr:uncharacterized mitochondrial protein AtMg00310-like [Manihot esculenta]